jgi:hypothetical protein
LIEGLERRLDACQHRERADARIIAGLDPQKCRIALELVQAQRRLGAVEARLQQFGDDLLGVHQGGRALADEGRIAADVEDGEQGRFEAHGEVRGRGRRRGPVRRPPAFAPP